MLEALKNKITLGDSFEILKKLPDKCNRSAVWFEVWRV